MSDYFNINSLIKYTGYPTKLRDNTSFMAFDWSVTISHGLNHRSAYKILIFFKPSINHNFKKIALKFNRCILHVTYNWLWIQIVNKYVRIMITHLDAICTFIYYSISIQRSVITWIHINDNTQAVSFSGQERICFPWFWFVPLRVFMFYAWITSSALDLMLYETITICTIILLGFLLHHMSDNFCGKANVSRRDFSPNILLTGVEFDHLYL